LFHKPLVLMVLVVRLLLQRQQNLRLHRELVQGY
jgi:hypothetical protein